MIKPDSSWNIPIFIEPELVETNSMAYGTRRFNAAFTRALQ